MKQQHCDRTACPVACALDILGDRWTLLIIRDLMFFNKHEYKDYLEAEEGISTNILSDRLKRLLDFGLIEVLPHPEIGTRKLYYLTPGGKDLIHTLTHLVRWSSEHLKDTVYIPEDQLKILQKNPELMIKNTLAELERWERKHGL
ncbi:MAG: helix-turn-helix transcriptional regulator [Gammaproteobacteria bacterium]|nr:helix-turn-helix transcriptional regulator [Gammaproteobacteria bacterium]